MIRVRDRVRVRVSLLLLSAQQPPRRQTVISVRVRVRVRTRISAFGIESKCEPWLRRMFQNAPFVGRRVLPYEEHKNRRKKEKKRGGFVSPSTCRSQSRVCSSVLTLFSNERGRNLPSHEIFTFGYSGCCSVPEKKDWGLIRRRVWSRWDCGGEFQRGEKTCCGGDTHCDAGFGPEISTIHIWHASKLLTDGPRVTLNPNRWPFQLLTDFRYGSLWYSRLECTREGDPYDGLLFDDGKLMFEWYRLQYGWEMPQ